MKLIIGIGNPGEKYKNNRHNVGFMTIDKLPQKSKIKIFKSQNFMNNSGEFVKKLVDQYKLDLSNLWVIHDDLDLRLGSYKIQFGKGPKEHKGLLSIYEKLGTKGFWHVRIGADNRGEDPTSRKASRGEDYVLEDFTEEERKVIDKVIHEVCKKLVTF
jgi:PTH1 family peptidyl-tRNA hydrolase